MKHPFLHTPGKILCPQVFTGAFKLDWKCKKDSQCRILIMPFSLKLNVVDFILKKFSTTRSGVFFLFVMFCLFVCFNTLLLLMFWTFDMSRSTYSVICSMCVKMKVELVAESGWPHLVCLNWELIMVIQSPKELLRKTCNLSQCIEGSGLNSKAI